jgi:hypothetical protein
MPPSSSSSGGSSFPCSAEMQQTLIFWPLHPLVLHTAVRAPDLRREGVRRYSGHYLCRCRGMGVVVVE